MSEEFNTNEPQERSPASRSKAPQSALGIPIAIVVAAGLIAGAIYFNGNSGPSTATTDGTKQEQQTTPDVEVQPINEDDHIRGNPNAPIVLIEYSDYECPFCKRFHETMNRIIGEYGPDGKVAWVYRHLPLESLHPNAPMIAEASECVAEQVGNEGFWTFTDLVFSERGLQDLTDPARLPEFAEAAGADPSAFQACVDSGKYSEAVQTDFDEAIAANGGTQGLGTPFTLVFVGDEYVAPISGAQPYEMIKGNIETILTQIEGGGGPEELQGGTQGASE